MKEEDLIFIISQPRSGSTYLQNLLSNNDSINTCSEHWLLLNFANQIKPSLLNAVYDNHLTKKAFDDYVSKFNINFIAEQKQFLLNLYEPLKEGFTFVIDKTPRYWEIIEEISTLFPKSKMIIIKRNPIDVATSIIKTWGIKNLEELSNYKRDLLIAPKKIYKFCLKNKTNPNLRVLSYEDLIQSTAFVVKSLYEWIGIEYDDLVLNTKTNNKYKGIYGDPFQNNESSTQARNKAKSKELSYEFKAFLKGYQNSLGEIFLKDYGYEALENNDSKSLVFKYFVHFSEKPNKSSFLKDFYWILKKYIYRTIIKIKN